MENPIKQIYKFNKEAGLLEKGYNDFLESSFQVEEALEGFDLEALCVRINGSTILNPCTAKDLSRQITGSCVKEVSDVDRLDKACDAVVFAVGSMAKLGLNPQQITKALNVVMQHNFAKLGMPKDEHGKLTKPDDFSGPEKELQKILDERT